MRSLSLVFTFSYFRVVGGWGEAKLFWVGAHQFDSISTVILLLLLTGTCHDYSYFYPKRTIRHYLLLNNSWKRSHKISRWVSWNRGLEQDVWLVPVSNNTDSACLTAVTTPRARRRHRTGHAAQMWSWTSGGQEENYYSQCVAAGIVQFIQEVMLEPAFIVNYCLARMATAMTIDILLYRSSWVLSISGWDSQMIAVLFMDLEAAVPASNKRWVTKELGFEVKKSTAEGKGISWAWLSGWGLHFSQQFFPCRCRQPFRSWKGETWKWYILWIGKFFCLTYFIHKPLN